MIRIAGINLLPKKQLRFALTKIRGIGKNNVKVLLDNVYKEILKVPELSKSFDSYTSFLSSKLGDLEEKVLVIIRNQIDANFLVEEDLRREVKANIDRIVDLGTFRGLRHKAGMPVRGQKTRRNTKTRRKQKKK
jgi:small subunit ribosomal protein S13